MTAAGPEDTGLAGLAGLPGVAGLAGVALAAGAGTRLRPLTDLRPKALCPVGNVALVDLALDRLAPLAGSGPERLAVNAHHGADALAAHLAARPGGVRLSVERPAALGSAGALGALRGWLDGRDVLVTNADVYLPAGLGALTTGWDGERCRLLCVPGDGPRDLPAGADARRPGQGMRYLGACLLPWRLVRDLRPEPTGLYEVLWRAEAAAGRLDLVTPDDVGAPGPALDCGTPARYLAANLDAVRRAVGTGTADLGGSIVAPTAAVSGQVAGSVVGAGTTVAGAVNHGVVWDGAVVAAGEILVEAVRAAGPAGPVTVRCREGEPGGDA